MRVSICYVYARTRQTVARCRVHGGVQSAAVRLIVGVSRHREVDSGYQNDSLLSQQMLELFSRITAS
jgi:hypothetical protein